MNLVVDFDQNTASLPAGFVAAVNYVVNLYDGLFLSGVTVTIDVGYGEIDGQPLDPRALGESEAASVNPINYGTLRTALLAQNAPGSSTLPASAPAGNPGVLFMTSAEEKALALTANNGSLDGYVAFGSATNLFSYGVNTAPPAGEYYFVGAVEHEISEVMGRVSYLDVPGDYSAMDLFRYAAPGVRQFSDFGSPSYFSINGGVTNLDNWNNFETGFFTDLGDWASSAGNDAFDAIGTPGVIEGLSSSDITLMGAIGWVSPPPPNPPPPAGTTADMILSSSGTYEIYDLGSNTILAAYSLGQVGTNFSFAGLGNFSGSDTSDMVLRSTIGSFEVYDISSNNVQSAASMGAVGNNWQVAGFGAFNGGSMTDMMLRDSNSGMFEVYDISNNSIVSAASLGAVGLDWQVAGFGDFSGRANETDMMLRNSASGAFEVYDIVGNSLVSASSVGAVGLDWQVAGFGDFSGQANETDMMLRNSSSGVFEVYDITANSIGSAAAIGAVGLDWQVAGFGPINGAGMSDMVLRNSGSGAFEVYDVASSQLVGAATLGAVGLNFQVSGIAALTAASSQSIGGAASQLAQAMAGFSPADAASTAGTAEPTTQQAALQLLSAASPDQHAPHA